MRLAIDKAGEAWRQVDAVLLTDDIEYTPVGREKPPFGYLASFALRPRDGAAWRGSGKELKVGAGWARPKLAGRDFSMWTEVDSDPKWWAAPNSVQTHFGRRFPPVFAARRHPQ